MTPLRIFFGILLAVFLGTLLYFGTDVSTGGFKGLFHARTRQPEGSSNTSSSTPANGTQSPDVTGKGFRGPTGEPHIIGPKSNPPNY